MKKLVFLFLMAISILSLSGIAYAASPWTEGKTYQDKVIGKLDFGFKNLLGGWTEIFTGPTKSKFQCKCVVTKSVVRVGKGVVYAIADTVGGALHVVTFPFPQIDVPLPNNGVDLK